MEPVTIGIVLASTIGSVLAISIATAVLYRCGCLSRSDARSIEPLNN